MWSRREHLARLRRDGVVRAPRRLACSPMIPPRINFIPLACRDVERMTRFLRSFGWPEAASSDEHHRVFQLTNGVVLALYAAANYEPAYGPVAAGFRGFTLAINLGSRAEVVAVREARAGIE